MSSYAPPIHAAMRHGAERTCNGTSYFLVRSSLGAKELYKDLPFSLLSFITHFLYSACTQIIYLSRTIETLSQLIHCCMLLIILQFLLSVKLYFLGCSPYPS